MRRRLQGFGGALVLALLVALLVAGTAGAAPALTCNAAPTRVARGQTVTFTATLTEVALPVTWSFGDGSASENGFVVNHAYTRSGTYVASAAVGSVLDVCTVQVKVNRPPVAGFVHPTPLPGSRLPVASTSFDEDGDPLDLSWSADGAPAGRGNALTLPFAAAPITVGLTAYDGLERDTATETVTPATAGITASTRTPAAGRAVTFTASPAPGRNDAFTYLWRFGDGTSASGRSVQHVFGPGPTRTVGLTVTDPYGGSSSAAVTIIPPAGSGGPPPPQTPRRPVAAFTAVPSAPRTGQVVLLSSSSYDPDGRVVRQRWDLDGDGRFDDASARSVRHVFRRAGAASVALRVVDNSGRVATAKKRLRVVRAPLRVLSPRPWARLRGVMDTFARATTMSVFAPRGATVRILCRGRGCPVRAVTRIASGMIMRVRAFERNLPAGTVLEVRVTRRGTIGRFISIRLIAYRRPAVRTACLAPGSNRPIRCP